jgi:hypothetical protein
MIATSALVDLSHTGAASPAADDVLSLALTRAGVVGHEVTMIEARGGVDFVPLALVVANDSAGRWAGTEAQARALAAALDRGSLMPAIAAIGPLSLEDLWHIGALVETAACLRSEPGEHDGSGWFTDWIEAKAGAVQYGIARVDPIPDAWSVTWHALEGDTVRGADVLIGDGSTAPRLLADGAARALPAGVDWRIEVFGEAHALVGVAAARDGVVSSWLDVGPIPAPGPAPSRLLGKLLPVLALVLLVLGACVGEDGPVAGPDGGGVDAIANSADARPADARPRPDAAPPADAEILGDCAVTCVGQDLSPWGTEYTVCRPSYARCLAEPRCSDVCAGPLTCSSPTNCQCDVAGAMTSCVAGNGP